VPGAAAAAPASSDRRRRCRIRRPQQQALRALVSEKLALESAREVVRTWQGLLASGVPPADVYQFSQLGDSGAAEFYDFSAEGEEDEEDW
jgi:hypothetical protein